VSVAAGDVDGDGRADVIIGSGPGGQGHVKAFSGLDRTLIRSFIGYAGYDGGIDVSTALLDGDGVVSIVATALAASGETHAKVFDGADQSERLSFFVPFSTIVPGPGRPGQSAAAPVNGSPTEKLLFITRAGVPTEVVAIDPTSLEVLDRIFGEGTGG